MPSNEEMDLYIGTKEVKAKPMTRGEFVDYVAFAPNATNRDLGAEGYLVEYLGGGDPNHPDHENYISWSPADVFIRNYTQVSPTSEEVIMKYFAYEHLPEHLQKISRPFAQIAHQMLSQLPRNPERSAGLRKLLEAKDCMVRANL